jgi:predicted permease
MVGVALVLLISCANLAGLLLARGASRTHEITVRVSLGARPGRLVRQALTETLTLSAIGGAAGLIIARWGAGALLRLGSSSGAGIPIDVKLDARVLGFALGASLLTGVLCGIVPALRFAGTQLHDSFKTGGRVVNAGSHGLPLGRMLVAAQIALSLILVAAAGLFVQTFRNYAQINPGYEAERVMGARLDVRAAGYTHAQLPGLYQRILDEVRAVPGVRSASLSMLNLAGGGRRTGGFNVPGSDHQKQGQVNFVTPDYFATTGIVLLRGRSFTEADKNDAPKVCIISQATAKAFFGTEDVIGKRTGYGTPPEFEIVGLVRDVRANFIKERPQNLVFMPLAQGPQEYITSIEARFTGAPEPVAAGIRAAVNSVDRMLPVRDVTPLSNVLARGLSQERMVARLATAFGALALLLAGIGLYGVMGYSVARRTNEMGVRLALGATPRAVWWVVLRDSLVTVVIGLSLGLALSYPILGLTRRLVWGLSPHDPTTLGTAMALLLVAGALAGMIPAWRASRIDPIQAIRAE